MGSKTAIENVTKIDTDLIKNVVIIIAINVAPIIPAREQ